MTLDKLIELEKEKQQFPNATLDRDNESGFVCVIGYCDNYVYSNECDTLNHLLLEHGSDEVYRYFYRNMFFTKSTLQYIIDEIYYFDYYNDSLILESMIRLLVRSFKI